MSKLLRGIDMERVLKKAAKPAQPIPTEDEIASYLFDLLGSAQRIAKSRGLTKLASILGEAREEAGRHY
jgi:hypothetical protein